MRRALVRANGGEDVRVQPKEACHGGLEIFRNDSIRFDVRSKCAFRAGAGIPRLSSSEYIRVGTPHSGKSPLLAGWLAVFRGSPRVCFWLSLQQVGRVLAVQHPSWMF
jgi:hypothetical protein